MSFKQELLAHIDQIHTTELGVIRIEKVLKKEDDIRNKTNLDVVEWCKEIIKKENNKVIRKGKNYYITFYPYQITVNASSYTIITVHLIKECVSV